MVCERESTWTRKSMRRHLDLLGVALLLVAGLACVRGRRGEADSDKGLSFVSLDERARKLVGDAAHARARYGQGTVIPLFSNVGFMSFLRNLICSMRRLRVHNWIVIAMDNATCPALMGKPGLGEQSACVYPYGEGEGVTSQQGVATYRSVAFNRMVMQRPLWVRFLLGEGLSVVQCDLDIVWLHDPQPLLRGGVLVKRQSYAPTFISSEHADALRQMLRNNSRASRRFSVSDYVDMVFQSEQAYGLNGGFYFARPTAATVAFFDDWLVHLKAMINLPSFEEQHALNSALMKVNRLPNRSLVYARLSEREFPNGKMWWSYPMEIDKRNAYIVHVNWVKQQKKTRMHRDRLWFLEPSDLRCSEAFDPFDGGQHPPCSKLCAAVGFAPLNGGNVSMKTCTQINNEDEHVLVRQVARYNKTGQWPETLANVFWHPLAYDALQDCKRRLPPGAGLECAPCRRRQRLPLAAEAYEAAFGAVARARGPPRLTFDVTKPW